MSISLSFRVVEFVAPVLQMCGDGLNVTDLVNGLRFRSPGMIGSQTSFRQSDGKMRGFRLDAFSQFPEHFNRREQFTGCWRLHIKVRKRVWCFQVTSNPVLNDESHEQVPDGFIECRLSLRAWLHSWHLIRSSPEVNPDLLPRRSQDGQGSLDCLGSYAGMLRCWFFGPAHISSSS
jgi:hypothetical protein